MGRKTRFVKVKIEFLLDVGRDVDVLPFEVTELTAPGGAVKFVAAGLRATLRPRNRSRTLVVMPVQRGMKLWYAKKKPAARPVRTKKKP